MVKTKVFKCKVDVRCKDLDKTYPGTLTFHVTGQKAEDALKKALKLADQPLYSNPELAYLKVICELDA